MKVTHNASKIVKWPDKVLKLIINNVIDQCNEPVLLLRLDETLKLHLGEQAGTVETLALDDLDGELLAADFAHRLHSRLADLLDYIVLIDLAGEALGLHHARHQTLATGLLREEQSQALVLLQMQAADWVYDEGGVELLARRRGEAQCLGWRLERDLHSAKVYRFLDDGRALFVPTELQFIADDLDELLR